MKWLLISVLIAIVLSRRYLVGDLVRSIRDFPRHYREGARRVKDPAAAAKPISARADDDKDS